jgi:hypothetical protein
MGLYLNPNADAFMEDESRRPCFRVLKFKFSSLGHPCRCGGGASAADFSKKIFPLNPLKISPYLGNVKKT